MDFSFELVLGILREYGIWGVVVVVLVYVIVKSKFKITINKD